MTAKTEESGVVPSEPHTSTPTLAESGSAPHSTDAEKQAPVGPPAIPGAPFPDGGLKGWAAVAGAWLAVFATFGYANTFGAYQGYYQFQGYPNEPASNISWIGSVQLFFQFSLGAVSGALYDKGYFRYLVVAGSVVYIVCLFMTSLAKEFWQTMLAQGIGIGIGTGLIFLPAISIISQYFLKRRSLAIGIVTTGSSVGGICLPIMLNNLIEQHGFPKAVQYSGYLLLGTLVLSCLLMHPRFVPASLRSGPMKKPSPAELFKSKPYSFLVAGLFFVAWGLFFPIFYIQVYAQDSGISPNITFYLLAFLNAASVFGRISPNFFADYIGNLNLMIFMCTGAGILSFSVFGANTAGGAIVVSIIFGFFSGGYVSLIGPALISMATHPSEIGIRMGMGFLATSFAALTGTPITGALLDRYGFYAPIVWSGVTILAGSVCFGAAIYFQRQIKGTWKVYSEIQYVRTAAMQSFSQHWRDLASGPAVTAHSQHPNKLIYRKKHRQSRSAEPPQIPFDAARLPLIARRKIGPPLTPPATPIRPATISPARAFTPTPTASSRFCHPIPTPSLATETSEGSSSPSGSVLLTPTTPPHLRWLGDDPVELEEPESPTKYAPTTKLAFWDTAVHAAQHVRPPLLEVEPVVEDDLGEVQISDLLSPVMLQHVPSGGGAVAALKRYDRSLRSDPSLSGMALFLNCPKRRVPFPSDEQLAKQRSIALEWRKLRNIGVGGRGEMRTVVHAVHTMNLGSTDSGIRLRSFVSLMTEMRYAQMLGIDTLVFHPGSTGMDGSDQAIDLCALADDLISLLDQVPNITLAIENSTHRCRGQLGRSISELAYLISRVGKRLKVCLDLCHLHVDQYDLSTPSGRMRLFADLNELGWENIAAVHVSDSLEVHGGRKDLHAKLGGGSIGLDGIREVLRHPKLLGKVPYLLETPSRIASSSRRRRAVLRRLEEESNRLERTILTEMLETMDEDWEDEEMRTTWWAGKKVERKAIERRIGRLLGKTANFASEIWRKLDERDERLRRIKLARVQSFGARERRVRVKSERRTKSWTP